MKEPTRISKGKRRLLCKCSKYDPVKDPPHTVEVYSDGWTKMVCIKCGQVKFERGKK